MNIRLMIKNAICVFSRIKWRLNKNKFPMSAEIGSSTYLRDSNIGRYTFIGPRCNINSADIGNYTCIAPGVQIGGMEHSYWWYSISPQLSDKYIFGERTTIGHDVWIAANAIIKQGITIGDGAVVGAGAFVNKDVPPYAIVVGTPAKILKYRFEEDVINKLNESRYWEMPPKEARAILESLEIVQ